MTALTTLYFCAVSSFSKRNRISLRVAKWAASSTLPRTTIEWSKLTSETSGSVSDARIMPAIRSRDCSVTVTS